jgi:hypothetical protein
MNMSKNKDKKENSLCIRSRPLWQRLLYPFVGIVLICLGILLWLTPVVMGWPLFFIGVPLLFCIHPRLELWGRRKTRQMKLAIGKKFKRK